LAFISGKPQLNWSVKYSPFCLLPTNPGILWDPELLQRQPRLISRCLPDPSHSIIILALSVIVRTVHCFMLFNEVQLPPSGWTVTNVNWTLQMIWLKLRTSLARCFIHQVKIHSVSRYYFKIYFSLKILMLTFRGSLYRKFTINSMMLSLFVYVICLCAPKVCAVILSALDSSEVWHHNWYLASF